MTKYNLAQECKDFWFFRTFYLKRNKIKSYRLKQSENTEKYLKIDHPMDQESIMLSDMPVQERQIPYDFTDMWNVKNTVNEQTKQKQIHTENILMAARGKRGLENWVEKVKGLRSTDW